MSNSDKEEEELESNDSIGKASLEVPEGSGSGIITIVSPTDFDDSREDVFNTKSKTKIKNEKKNIKCSDRPVNPNLMSLNKVPRVDM
jgi:hypothetical protein